MEEHGEFVSLLHIFSRIESYVSKDENHSIISPINWWKHLNAE